MPRQGPRRPLLNLRVSAEEQDRLRERAEQENEGNVSELGRRMIRFASHAMPKDWDPRDHIHVPDPDGQVDYTPGDGRPPFKATQVCITPAAARRFNGVLDSDGYYQGMWRTEDGRWVFDRSPMDLAKPELYEFISDQQARDWLERNEHHEVVREFLRQGLNPVAGSAQPASRSWSTCSSPSGTDWVNAPHVMWVADGSSSGTHPPFPSST